MAEDLKRDFKGVWIPRELWLDTNISKTEMLLLVEVHSFSLLDKGCFASNQHFANFLGISKDRVSKVITSLTRKGYLKSHVKRDKNKKVLSRTLILTYGQNHLYPIGENTYTPIGENDQDNNTYINNTNNTLETSKKRAKTEFKPPTIEEIEIYVQDKISSGHSEFKGFDVHRFFDYYDAADWHKANGKKVVNWKQCLVGWVSRGYDSRQETKEDDDGFRQPLITEDPQYIEMQRIREELRQIGVDA